ncbi:hypothetical protein ACFLUZ_07175, partial [Chloroflexota bacterium]
MATIRHMLTWVANRFRPIFTTRKKVYIIPWFFIILIILMAAFADFLAPHAPDLMSLPNKLKPPFWIEGGSTRFLLGTDTIGRDILSRIIYGARVSLVVAAAGLVVAGFIGCILGLI